MTEHESQIYERFLMYFSTDNYENEISKGRSEYEQLVAPLQTDDPHEEYRLNFFHNWYLFFRKIRDVIRTPAKLVIEGTEMDLKPEERKFIETWSEGIHSLFLVKKVSEEFVYLKNLMGKENFKVHCDGLHRMFHKTNFIEAHIYKADPSEKQGMFRLVAYRFLPGICVHPKDAEKYIADQAKKASFLGEAQRQELLLHLQKCKLKADRYSNVKPGAFYSEQPLF